MLNIIPIEPTKPYMEVWRAESRQLYVGDYTQAAIRRRLYAGGYT